MGELHEPYRRDFLAFAAGAVTSGTVLPMAARGEGRPDAELLAIAETAAPLIVAYHSHLAEYFALDRGSPDPERVAEEGTAPYEAIEELTERAMALRATTFEGVIAKARLARFWAIVEKTVDGVVDVSGYGMDVEMSWSLLNDILAMQSA